MRVRREERVGEAKDWAAEVKSRAEPLAAEERPARRVGPGVEREEARPKEEETRPEPAGAAGADRAAERSDPWRALRPVWAEIDLDAIAHNVRALKSLIPDGTLFLAVVKANAYGHGAVPVAWEALAAGADRLGVALPDEGVRLRQAGIQVPIHLLSMPSPGQAELVAEYDLIPAVSDLEVARALSRAAAERGR
ncbi:MAG: alanine racemase, partial [Bacillota bacterium]|nr:alanine racemase [Bacillota bacterium]